MDRSFPKAVDILDVYQCIGGDNISTISVIVHIRTSSHSLCMFEGFTRLATSHP